MEQLLFNKDCKALGGGTSHWGNAMFSMLLHGNHFTNYFFIRHLEQGSQPC